MALSNYLYDICGLCEKAVGHAALTASTPATMECSTPLKMALLTAFDGSSAKAHTFLAECNNYINLSQSQFPSNCIQILWALQLCTNRAANWKRVQLELADSDGFDVPDHLLTWKDFQVNFRLKWGDLNTKEKA